MTASQFLPGLLILVVVSAVSGAMDIREHRISNKVLLIALFAGGAWLALSTPSLILSYGLAGFAVGLALLLPLYAIGTLGAGDVKLAAVGGVFLGPMLTATAVALSLVIGGAVALVVYFYAFRTHHASVGGGGSGSTQSEPPRPGTILLPFGFAIGTGFSALGLYQYIQILGAL